MVTLEMFLSDFWPLSPGVSCLSPAVTNFTIPDGVSHTDPADCAPSLRRTFPFVLFVSPSCRTKISQKGTKLYAESKDSDKKTL